VILWGGEQMWYLNVIFREGEERVILRGGEENLVPGGGEGTCGTWERETCDT
jgi:hypothetical protein